MEHLRVVPPELKEANAFVSQLHRQPPQRKYNQLTPP